MEAVPNRLLRLPEASEVLGLSRSKTYALAASGELPTVRIGRSTWVSASLLRAWLDRLRDDFARGTP